MKYLMLIYGNQEKWDSILADEWPKEIAKQDAFNKKYQQTGDMPWADIEPVEVWPILHESAADL